MWARAIVAIVLWLLPTAAFAQSEKRIALLIGNKDYKAGVGSLTNPLNDIRIVGDALKTVGFEVLKPAQNATRAAMLRAILEFAAKLKAAGPNAVGFLYYSGHGIASAGENYLIPVDVEEPSTVELSVQGVRHSEVLAILRGEAPNAAHYLVLDACRNTLQGARGGKGFVPVGQQSGVLVAFATEPGKTASDTGQGSGPYATALAAELVKPGQNDLLMFHNVRVAVMDKTNRDQVPWTEDGIQRRQRVLFGGETAKSATSSLPPPTTPVRLSEAAEAWDRTKDATNIVALEAFIRRFSDTYYGDLAKVRLTELKQAVETAARQKADQEVSAKAEAERQRLALLQQEERKRAEAEEVRREAEIQTEQTDCISGDFERQIRSCTALIARDQSNAIAYNNRGNAFSKKKDFDRALDDYNKAIEIDPKFSLAYSGRGHIFRYKQDYDGAISDYTKAIAFDPKFANAYISRGLVFEKKNDIAPAIADFRKALELDPNLAVARENLKRFGLTD